MPLLGHKATNCLPTSFILFSHTAMSLSWLPSYVTVTYTRSGAPVAATVTLSQKALTPYALNHAGPTKKK